jgi:hypothetical protein
MQNGLNTFPYQLFKEEIELNCILIHFLPPLDFSSPGGRNENEGEADGERRINGIFSDTNKSEESIRDSQAEAAN